MPAATHTLRIRPDGSLLVSAEHHNRVHLWNAESGEQLAEVHAEMGPLYGVAIDSAAKLVAAVGEGGEKLWRMERTDTNGSRFVDEVRLTGHTSPVRGVAFSPDGKLLVTSGDNGVTMLYDTTTRSAVAALSAGGPSAFSPDSRHLAVAETSASTRTRQPTVDLESGRCAERRSA